MLLNDTHFVPLHLYFVQGTNAMYAKPTADVSLPDKQVVRTSARGFT